MVPSDKCMNVFHVSNTVFQLVVLSCGIVLKSILEIAKLNKLLRQNSNFFLSYLDIEGNSNK